MSRSGLYREKRALLLFLLLLAATLLTIRLTDCSGGRDGGDINAGDSIAVTKRHAPDTLRVSETSVKERKPRKTKKEAETRRQQEDIPSSPLDRPVKQHNHGKR